MFPIALWPAMLGVGVAILGIGVTVAGAIIHSALKVGQITQMVETLSSEVMRLLNRQEQHLEAIARHDIRLAHLENGLHDVKTEIVQKRS